MHKPTRFSGERAGGQSLDRGDSQISRSTQHATRLRAIYAGARRFLKKLVRDFACAHPLTTSVALLASSDHLAPSCRQVLATRILTPSFRDSTICTGRCVDLLSPRHRLTNPMMHSTCQLRSGFNPPGASRHHISLDWCGRLRIEPTKQPQIQPTAPDVGSGDLSKIKSLT